MVQRRTASRAVTPVASGSRGRPKGKAIARAGSAPAGSNSRTASGTPAEEQQNEDRPDPEPDQTSQLSREDQGSRTGSPEPRQEREDLSAELRRLREQVHQFREQSLDRREEEIRRREELREESRSIRTESVIRDNQSDAQIGNRAASLYNAVIRKRRLSLLDKHRNGEHLTDEEIKMLSTLVPPAPIPEQPEPKRHKTEPKIGTLSRLTYSSHEFMELQKLRADLQDRKSVV